MTPTLTHIAMHVGDLAASFASYREFCGMWIVHERAGSEGGEIVWMAEPGRLEPEPPTRPDG